MLCLRRLPGHAWLDASGVKVQAHELRTAEHKQFNMSRHADSNWMQECLTSRDNAWQCEVVTYWQVQDFPHSPDEAAGP